MVTAETNVDVLIIGAGPASLMAADVLSRFSKQGLSFRIIDKRPKEMDLGQADGINSRTLEIFESLGIVEYIEKEACRMSEVTFWSPDEHGHLRRTGPTLSPACLASILHQARVEHFLREDAEKWSDGSVKVEYGVVPESLSIGDHTDETGVSRPVQVVLRHLSDEEATPVAMSDHQGVRSGLYKSTVLSADEEENLYCYGTEKPTVETIHAQYVIGCDGAHSWTRRTLGLKMVGDQTTYIWGVIDAAPKTNFPDIRKRCAIHSASAGALMVIPQERNLVRLYIQLPMTVQAGQYLDKSAITPDKLLQTANEIMKPFTFETNYIEWFTAYHIGQRLLKFFCKDDRVFLAGDACHTHSPKAGQGMNTSLQDTWNLGWKLGLVLTGVAKPELLSTYSEERQTVAQDLIDYDTRLAAMFSSKPQSKTDRDGVDMNEFKSVIEKGHEFASGVLITYAESIATRESLSKPELATQLRVGRRLFGVQVVNHSSATADILTQILPFTGAFYVLVFAGDVARAPAMDRLRKLAEYLDSPESVVSKYTPMNRSRTSVIDVVTVHAAPRQSVELYDFPQPSIFPGPEEPGRYGKVYADDMSYHRGHGNAYEAYGVSKEQGAMVVVRPDQHVGLITDLEDTQSLDTYFQSFMLAALRGHPATQDRWRS